MSDTPIGLNGHHVFCNFSNEVNPFCSQCADLRNIKPMSQEQRDQINSMNTNGGRLYTQSQVAEQIALAVAEYKKDGELIYQLRLADGSWIDQTEQSYLYNVDHGMDSATVRIVVLSTSPTKGG